MADGGRAAAGTAGAPEADLTAVICHYNPTGAPYLQHLVTLCVATLRRVPDARLKILVCDGSPEPDPDLAATFVDERVGYLHAGRQLSFGATYNLGLAAARTDYVALIANDILITAPQLRQLKSEVRADVACAIPYLTRADYATQVTRRARVPRRCYPASMTINVNVFRRQMLDDIGGVPEELSGSFNDMVIVHRLRRRGYRLALVHVGEVDHLRAVTRRTASNMVFERDLALAPTLAPQLFRGLVGRGHKNLWAHLYANESSRRLPRWLWRLVSLSPWRLNQQRGVGFFAAWLEPYLSCDYGVYWRALARRGRGP